MAKRGGKRQRPSARRSTKAVSSSEDHDHECTQEEKETYPVTNEDAEQEDDHCTKTQRVEESLEPDVKSAPASVNSTTNGAETATEGDTMPIQSSDPHGNEFSQESGASESRGENSANTDQDEASTSDNPFLPASNETQDNDPAQNNVLEAMLSFVLEDKKKKKTKPTSDTTKREVPAGTTTQSRRSGPKRQRIPRFVGKIPAKDWSIKERAIFISSQSFEWISLQSGDEHNAQAGEGASSGYEEPQQDTNFGRLIPFSALDEVALEGNCHHRIKELAKSFQYRWDYRQFTPRNAALWKHENTETITDGKLPIDDFDKFMKSVISCLHPKEMPPGPYIFRLVHNILRNVFDEARRYYCFPSSDFLPQVYTGMVAASRRLINSQSVNENDKAEGSRFFGILDKWHQSLRSAAAKVVSGAQEYVVVKYEKKNIVVLRRASQNTLSGPIAIIARSTRGTRNILRRVGIPFSMPLSSSSINDNEDM